MTGFTSVTIIYNPNSTGNGLALAKNLKKDLKTAGFKLKVDLMATEYAGHAQKIAYKKSKESKYPLIISASGDGGYNEVINGIMEAKLRGAKPVAGLLPAGNANDHFNNVQENDIVTAIMKHHTKQIDLLKLTSKQHKKPFTCYAHSYIGFGLTPKVGKTLNKTKLNKVNEVIIALKTTISLRPTKIEINETTRSFYSLVATNLKSMAKVLKLAEDTSVTDGKFELVTFPRSSKLQLFKTLIKSTLIGLNTKKQLTDYRFKTINPTLCQLDGEVHTLDAKSEVKISVENKALTCIY